MWNMNRTVAPAVIAEEPVSAFELEKAVWSETALFDELNQLGDADIENLRQMLQSESNKLPGASPK